MATPSYKGPNQPAADDGGFWSGLSSWFGGGGTPAYQGEGQPSSSSSGFFGGATPAYKSAPSSSSGVSTSVRSLDPSLFPQGPFAIVVPRSFVPPCDVTDPQQ
jgi:hypothetical protein